MKDKGQHILKNPLVINSMIEKVRTLVLSNLVHVTGLGLGTISEYKT